MARASNYGQFCPVAMAAEVVCTRWTALVLRELLCGSTRFNELRRGVPLMSPALLSKRLRELEDAGIVAREELGAGGTRYRLTEAGEDLRPIIMALGSWGQRWVETRATLRNLDPSLLMWDMRRGLDISPLPARRSVIQFLYPEISGPRGRWWLVIDRGEVDLCSVEPGFPVDLYVETDLRTMTSIWMGLTTVRAAVDDERLRLDGRADLRRSMQHWLGLSPFAREEKRTAA